MAGVLSTNYSQNAIYDEALVALVTLGIPKSNAEKGLIQAWKSQQGDQDVKVEELIRLVLRG